MITDVSLALGAAALATVATATLLRYAARLPQAAPNDRSLHLTPVPRVGGLAIWAGFLPVAALAPSPAGFPLAGWIGPWILLALVSLRDDWRSVGVAPRLAVHTLASLWLASSFADSAVFVVAAALACAWALNLYNFMDGSDGLAATMSVVGFAAYAAALAYGGMPATLPLSLAAATVPVLFVNRPPARMFLGDVGAVPLGFLAAAFGIAGVAAGWWAAWFPLLVFLPFVADASVTLLRRVLSGERFWQSHRSHYYQRLHRLGAGHTGTLAVWSALMAGTASSAVLCACLAPEWGGAALAAWCAVHAVVFAGIDYHWRRSAPTT